MMEKTKALEEVNPPWVEYTNIDPEWMFWREGEGEDWMCNTWLPYWYQLNTEERKLRNF